MAPEISAAARAHGEIKQLIMTGELPLRTRIDIDALARRLMLSSMPVRQALALLLWERLLSPGSHGGYEVALWSERDLKDLYTWRGALTEMLLASHQASVELKRIAATQPYVEASWNVMRALEIGANRELIEASRSADERLQLSRRVEEEVLNDAQAEFEVMVAAIADRARNAKTLVRAFHRRRSERAGVLRQRAALRALPNNGANG